MAHRIEIALKQRVYDARGQRVVRAARGFLNLPIRSCLTRDVYKIDTRLSLGQLRKIRKAFTDPVTSVSSVGRYQAPRRFDWLIEVAFKEGVTDNVGRTAQVVVGDVLNQDLSVVENVYSATQYFIRGDGLTRDHALQLAQHQVANELIHSIQVFSPDEWAMHPIDESIPVWTQLSPVNVRTYDVDVSDDELLKISRKGILSLNLEEMHAIRDYYALPAVRAERLQCGLPAHPTDVELECFAQTWSEHCKHKIFASRVRYTDDLGQIQTIDSLFKTFIRASTEEIATRIDWLVSVFSDNAGIIRFDDRYNLVFKVETHNSPSALDPYGGAITGIVGCNRDPMGTGMGSELLCNTWGYCLGSPFYEGDLPQGLFHPRRIRDGVHLGVIDGGNQSGIPWVRGMERFDERFIGKPLVFCGTVGRIPIHVGGRPSERKEVNPGDVVVMVGGRIGKDGIHGATFSSEELRAESPAQAVQIGDPITQRKMYEFLIEARDAGLYRAITDNGAGGLSSSVGEMARLCGGAEVDLSLCPLKYEGLQPWEIFVSEAQERMTLAVQPENVVALISLARRRDVEATALGIFTDSGKLLLRYGDKIAARLDMSFLHDGCPVLELEGIWTPPKVPHFPLPKAGPRTKILMDLLGRLNICSREYKSRMYDSEVKGLSIVKPFTGVEADVPSDASAMFIDHGSRKAVLIAEGINPFFSDLDTYHMMSSVIDEGVRRIISSGGALGRIAGLDNFCWPDPVVSASNPDGAYKMAQLVRANQALYDTTTAFDVPCISGKDSMKNDSVRGGRKISIPPTVLFSTIGILDDTNHIVTLSFKDPGDAIYVVGVTRNELGATEFARLMAERSGAPHAIGGQVPTVNTELAGRLYRAMYVATSSSILQSSHTPTVGGLAVAFVLCCMGGNLGADIHLSQLPVECVRNDDAAMFAESNSRFVVSCSEADIARLEQSFDGLPLARIGTVVEEQRLCIHGLRGRKLVDARIHRLRASYQETLDGL